MAANKPKSTFQRFAQCVASIGPTMGKTADNPFFKSKYVPLPIMLTELRPHLDANDLTLTYPNGFATEKGTVNVMVEVRCSLTGELAASSGVTLPCPDDAQKATAAITYGRRTVTASVFGIAEKDDDGNSAQPEVKRASLGSESNSGAVAKDLW